MICPVCGRNIKIRYNHFGDAIFWQHKMAYVTDLNKPDADLHNDYKPGHDATKYPLWQIDCPNSNQFAEE